MKRIASLLMLLIATGCGPEVITVRTHPPLAKLYVEDNYVGQTPTTYSASRGQLGQPIHYVLERDGYVTAQGFFPVRRSGGRLVGAIFTLGLLVIFKPVTTFSQDTIDIGLQPAVAVDPVRRSETIEEKINALKRLRDSGDITPEEFERYKRKALEEM